MPMAKSNCRYCSGRPVKAICANCREKLEIVRRIKAMLDSLLKEEQNGN